MLPVGATEQHGPHLATGTDASDRGRRSRERGGGRGVAAGDDPARADARLRRLRPSPALRRDALARRRHLPARSSRTCSRRPRRPAAGASSSLNAHGGNAAACAVAVAEASREHGLVAATALVVGPRRPGSRGPLHGHAGSFETSLMLALDPGPRAARAASPSPGGAGAQRVRAASSSPSRDAGRSSTASPTARRGVAERGEQALAACVARGSRALSSRSPTSVPDVAGPTIAAVETTTVTARAKPGLKVRGAAGRARRLDVRARPRRHRRGRRGLRRGQRDGGVERRGRGHGDALRPRRARARV